MSRKPGVYTVVIALSDGGDTAMRILGHEELAFTGEAARRW